MKKIIAEKSQYYDFSFYFDFSQDMIDYCRSLKMNFGKEMFGYIPEKKCWGFKNPIIGIEIKNKFPDIIMDKISAIAINRAENDKLLKEQKAIKSEEIKRKIQSDIEIPGFKGELYPYQKVGVEFFVNNHGRAILADEMGAGKTCTSLAYLVYERLKKTLVICPASVKYAWQNEVEKWTKLKPFVIDSKTDIGANINTIFSKKYSIYIINYDILKKFPILAEMNWNCVIVDEFQMLKNASTIRYKYAKKIIEKSPRLLLLSGTPLLSRPIELFNGLNLLDGFTWNNWFKYTSRYCNGHFGRFGYDARGASNIDELRQRISPYFIRRTKKDILPNLPPKRYIDLPIKLDEKTRREYEIIQTDLAQYLKEQKNKKDDEINRSMRAEPLVKLNELRTITTISKLPYVVELINNIIEGGEKVVVFSVYNFSLEELKEKYGDIAVLITGKISTEKRQESIDKFQNNPKIKVFLGGLKSAGVGITLTAASNIIFLDFSWTPADHKQGSDRIHRPGQTADCITIYQLFALDTIDHYMYNLLTQKQKIFDQLIEEKEIINFKQQNLIADITNIIRKKYQ